jgi:hypothetical protein
MDIADPPHTAVHTFGMLPGMARQTKRTTLTLDIDALDLAERASKARGMSLSAMVSRAIRNEAIRLGAPPVPSGDELDAIQDEAERAAMAQEDRRRTG